MEELKYIIEDSTIAELLGVQNFSTDEAAILELVKNAYDAKAIRLTLKFEEDQLDIIDNGVGMDKTDIKEHWMHIGKSNKKYEIVDENNRKRIQAGSKGVGRFALSRLGRDVKIHTKKNDSQPVIWKTDWNGSTLGMSTKKAIGTHIIIKGLREKWGKRRIENLCLYLEKTYNDTAMEIRISSNQFDGDKIVPIHFPEVAVGKNCKSNIVLKYGNGILTTIVNSDEFLDEARNYCPKIDLNKYRVETNLYNEFQGSAYSEFVEEDLKEKINAIGAFSANLFFNFSALKVEQEKFLYKYLETPESVETGIILYRNAFSISSYEGKKDWLGLGVRSRKSPAAATHPTGAWRVRENQLAGFVKIDKKENSVLEDLANRQGLNENSYYQLFIKIILIGIKEFERYRQSIIRQINSKNINPIPPKTPVSNKVMRNPMSVSKLTEDEAKQLVDEIKTYKKEGSQYKKDKEDVEARYKYDVRILNVLATTGLKAASIAHELKNDRNTLCGSYESIVNALKEYGLWDELNSEEKTKKSYKSIPYLLKSSDVVGKKLLSFMDTMLAEIEKRQFESKYQSVLEILKNIKEVWERDYAWISINIEMNEEITYRISEDMIQVVMDNLILNSVQQNDKSQHLNIDINFKEFGELIKFAYSDDGIGLDKKYTSNPLKILEVHETTRADGHGLGMWIVNNTVVMSGGEVKNISGDNGFNIEFTIGGKF